MEKSDADLSVARLTALTRGGMVVFYVGAGFSIALGMPNWHHLLTGISSKLLAHAPGLASVKAHVDDAISVGNYRYAASVLKFNLPEDFLQEELDTAFSFHLVKNTGRRATATRRISSLMRTPSAGIITTNYDDVFESHPEFSSVFVKFAPESFTLNHLPDSRPRDGRRFFLKLHGDIGRPKVLSSEDYDEMYLQKADCKLILQSVLLQRSVIFLGCSLEDSILALIRQLHLIFADRLPAHIWVAPRSVDGEIRAMWLLHYAGIRTIFYNNDDRTHKEFDPALEGITAAISSQYRVDFGFGSDSLARAALSRGNRVGLAEVGTVNQRVVEIVRLRSGSRIRYLELLEIASRSIPEVALEDLIYRVSFLVGIGMLREGDANGRELIFESDGN